MAEKTITVELHQRSNYQFEIEFSEGMPHLLSDEPSPLGEGKGPSPAGSWIRSPHMSLHKPFSQEGCTIFVKTGHLLDQS